jgi:hypothetical protein
MSILEIPGIYAEWALKGVDAVTGERRGDNLFERLSLLDMVMIVQARTPDDVEFMHGETYAMLPVLLLPRFIVKDKPISQVVLNTLSIRYGLASPDEGGAVSATFSWGTIAEAYANFGTLGIIGIAAVMGAMMGAISRWSIGKPAASLPTLTAIGSLAAFTNMGIDFSYMCTFLFQMFTVVAIFFGLTVVLSRREA